MLLCAPELLDTVVELTDAHVTFSADELIVKVVNSLQQETDAARQREWDAVCVSQYLYELKEAKKQGRKEKRHKEAQTVLAAATAAAAASSRISSLRKDNIEESMHQEVVSSVMLGLRIHRSSINNYFKMLV